MSGNPFQPLVVLAVAGMITAPVVLVGAAYYAVQWVASGAVHWPSVAVGLAVALGAWLVSAAIRALS